jgi:Capsule assembly protein Wzi/PAP2 superfamily
MTKLRDAFRYGILCLVILTLTGGCFAAPRPQEPQGATPDSKDSNAADKPREKEQPKQDKPKRDRPQRDKDEAPEPAGANRTLGGLAKGFVSDQKNIWTSPARLRFADADWLLPAGGFAAGLFATDSDFSRHLSNSPQTISHYKNYSTAGVGALIGAGAGLWLLSYPSQNEHWRETGLLAGEAAIDSLIPVELMKYSLRRQRPYQGDGSGPFFQGGSSFPSEHAAAAWAIAGVFAHEYPGFFPKIVSYGLASFVSYSRIRGKQHFPSDVFIGSLIGQLVAQNVYSRHHDPTLGGEEWRSIGEIVRGDGHLSASSQGSPYVPLDSWIYPAFDRLIAMGFVRSAGLSMRPWTRLECLRLLDEAQDSGGDSDTEAIDSPQGEQLIATLRQEFAGELKQLEYGNPGTLQVESLYTRFTGISGTPLVQGTHYDFGQTLINDFGRPYEEGFNNVTGFSTWGSSGRVVGYVRGEYQYAPSGPGLPGLARLNIKEMDSLPEIPSPNPSPATNRFRLLDAYVGVTASNWQFSLGRQSLWWGPGAGGPMLVSNNAEPIDMFRIATVSPLELPWIFRRLGLLRVEFFVGRPSGQEIAFGRNFQFFGQVGTPLADQPWLHGQKFSLRPTKNLEFSFARTTIFAGPAVPFTAHELWFSLTSSSNGFPGSSLDPGDRRSSFDFTYRLPKLRNWVTFYVDGFTDDQFSPIAYWDRSAWSAGLYFPQLPKLPKLDLRIEGVFTDVPAGGNIGHGFFYFNLAYRNGYTNDGNLIGSWIGRQGQGAQAWMTYSISPKSSIQFNYRHEKISNELLFGGGTINDAGVKPNIWLGPNLSVSGLLQYEKWNFPVLAPNAQTNFPLLAPYAQSNFTTSLGITYWPRRVSK